jgi:hypothetical protein
MPLQLRQHESVLFPMPYLEEEAHPFVVTNQRLVQTLEGRERVLYTQDIESVTRGHARPLFPFGLALIVFGLGTLATGAYLVFSVWGMKAAPITSLWQPAPEGPPEGADPSELPPPSDAEADGERKEGDVYWPDEVLRTRLAGQGLLMLGMFLAGGGLKLAKRRRYFVVCHARSGVMKVRAASENQQTQILMTVQAVLG